MSVTQSIGAGQLWTVFGQYFVGAAVSAGTTNESVVSSGTLLVTNAAGEVLLVKHTYLPGWYMPGGGLERGETAEQALARELVEEAGVRITGRALLVSLHSNHVKYPGDHVLIYRVEAWTPCEATSRGEINAVAWYDPAALPAEARVYLDALCESVDTPIAYLSTGPDRFEGYVAPGSFLAPLL